MGYDLPMDWKVCTVWWGEGEKIRMGKGGRVRGVRVVSR